MRVKVANSSVLIKTNDCEIEHLKEDKKKLETAYEALNDKKIKLVNGLNRLENQRGFLAEQWSESKKRLCIIKEGEGVRAS